MAAIAMTVMTLGSCASKRMAVKDSANTTTATRPDTGTDNQAVRSLTFVQKVSDNAVYAKNIAAKIDFTLKSGKKDLSVDGSIKMRKDEVIRIQLSPFGLIEVGRIELTPDYVLIIDRVHKEYIKETYDRVPFLQRNGLSFYTLQALFWNQLFIPGQSSVGENSLKLFTANVDNIGQDIPVTLRSGKLEFTWNADKLSGKINSAIINYADKAAGTATVNWQYSAFKAVGAKNFPATQVVTVRSTALGKNNGTSLTIKMGSISTDSDWDAHTQVSGKYRKVTVEEVMKKIGSLQ